MPWSALAKQMENKGSQQNEFREWLDRLCKEYQALSNDKKNQTLDQLISRSGAPQLNHLSTLLPKLLYRDFISLLPQEVAYHILKCLDGKTLLTCCSVSKTWNVAIHQSAKLWWLKAIQSGATDVVYFGSVGTTRKYKTLYLRVQRILAECRRKSCLLEHSLGGHRNRVMAVCYQDGRIATGSDDQSVRVWDAHTGNLLHHINTHTVCDLKLTSSHVYTASFDGTAAIWKLTSGELQHRLVGHTSAVFSIDAHKSGIVLTGSSDKSVKIWATSAGSPVLLTTLSEPHSEWVTKVRFLNTSASSTNLMFASVDKNACHVWISDVKGHCTLLQSTQSVNGVQITSFSHTKPDTFYLCSWKDKELCNFLLCYKFSFQSLCLVSSMSLGGDIPLRCQLLGAGCKFAVLMGSSDINQMFIFSFTQNRCVAGIKVPSCRSTRNGATLTLGSMDWLDGFDGTLPSGTLLAACLQNCNDVLLLNWRV